MTGNGSWKAKEWQIFILSQTTKFKHLQGNIVVTCKNSNKLAGGKCQIVMVSVVGKCFFESNMKLNAYF